MAEVLSASVDSVAIRAQRSRLFLPSGRTTLRAVANGINVSVPNSLSFSTIQSARSPLGTADATDQRRQAGVAAEVTISRT